IVFVSPYENPGGEQVLTFEPQTACLLDPTPVDNLLNCGNPTCGNLIRFSSGMWPPVSGSTVPHSGTSCLEMSAGTHMITFPGGPASSFRCTFTRNAAASTAHIAAFDQQGVTLAQLDAPTTLPIPLINFQVASA